MYNFILSKYFCYTYLWKFYLYVLLEYVLIFVLFNIKLFKLGLIISNNNVKNTDTMMHLTLTIIVTSLVKDPQWMMTNYKWLVQGQHRIKNIHQLVDTFFPHKQVSNMLTEIYIIHLICFSQYSYFLFFCEYL